ncbi:MAG: hypothetical protein RL385_525 [Pseudomonadota bacterium]|jgi:hypothetical protein
MSRALASWTVCNEAMLFYANGGNYVGPDYDAWYEVVRTGRFRYYIGATGEDFRVTGQERSRAAVLFKERQLSFAVVTDSALVRGFATALGWLGTNVAAFSWAHSDDAGLWLGHAPDVARALSDELRRVKWRLEEQLRMQRAAP